MSRLHRVLAVALLASVGLTAFAGCQDGDDDPEEGSTTAPTPGAVDVIDGDVLLERFPETVGPYPVGATSTDLDGALGFQVSRATARYTQDINKLGPAVTINVLDMGNREMVTNMGYPWAIGDAATDAEQFDGHPVRIEEGERTRTRKLQIIVGERFLVEVIGEAIAPDRVDEAARALDLDGLAALAG